MGWIRTLAALTVTQIPLIKITKPVILLPLIELHKTGPSLVPVSITAKTLQTTAQHEQGKTRTREDEQMTGVKGG